MLGSCSGCDGKKKNNLACNSTADCAWPQICFEGLCQTTACTQDHHCNAALACVDGFCAVQGCAENVDCPTLATCSDESCRWSCELDDSCSCALDTDCPLDFCQGTQRCALGVCVGTGNPCTDSELQCDGELMGCKSAAETQACTSDANCLDDERYCSGEEYCSNGTCVSTGNPCTYL